MASRSVYARNSRSTDVETLAHFEALVARGARRMRGWHLQSLDLSGQSGALGRLDPAGAVFLGCAFAPGDEDSLRRRGALIFPNIPDVPFNAYRGGLYSPRELYAGLAERGYERTPDAQAYAWTRRVDTRGDLHATLATALHDHAISDALDDALGRGPLAGNKVVGVMGGHAGVRGSADYLDAVRLGRALARGGRTVATGGGPGAMEAANLGAYLSAAGDDVLGKALARLEEAPDVKPTMTEWALAAADALDLVPDGMPSLGIPTWFYGHEPPNMFATHIAKYFTNSVREAVLLQRCTGGIVFLPGAAGTVQEIFQDACENYYGSEQTVTPMVLVGVRHWSRELPAWPLLQALADGRPFGELLHLVDTVDEAAALLLGD